MPAPGISTFDGNPETSPPTTTPYRPGTSDFNGAALADDPTYPPDPQTMPTANLFNTIALLLVSACKMIPFAIVSVTAGASPVIAFWNTAANDIDANPFTLARTAAGNYTLSWTAGAFPSAAAQPVVALNLELGAHNYGAGAVYGTNSVQVTTTEDGALADLPFTVMLF